MQQPEWPQEGGAVQTKRSDRSPRDEESSEGLYSWWWCHRQCISCFMTEVEEWIIRRRQPSVVRRICSKSRREMWSLSTSSRSSKRTNRRKTSISLDLPRCLDRQTLSVGNVETWQELSRRRTEFSALVNREAKILAFENLEHPDRNERERSPQVWSHVVRASRRPCAYCEKQTLNYKKSLEFLQGSGNDLDVWGPSG